MRIIVYTFFSLLIFPAYLQGQSVAHQLAAESCQCVQEVSATYIDDIEQLTNSCIQEAISQNIDWLKQRYDWSSSTSEAEQLGEQLGQEIGSILVSECQALIDLLKSEDDVELRTIEPARPVSRPPTLTSAPQPQEEEASLADEFFDANVSIGRLLALHGKELATFVIVDEYGDRLSFLWITPFEGDNFFSYGMGAHEGRNVKVYWQPVELYHPSSRDYQKTKVVVGLEFTN